jgi:hypothetical protein
MPVHPGALLWGFYANHPEQKLAGLSWVLRAALWELEVDVHSNMGFHGFPVAGGRFKCPLTHSL